MEELELHTAELFGTDVMYFYHHGTRYFACTDVCRALNVSQGRLKTLMRRGFIRLAKKQVEPKRPARMFIALPHLLMVIGMVETNVTKEINMFLFKEVLPAIAKDGEYIMPKDRFEPTVDFIKNLKK